MVTGRAAALGAFGQDIHQLVAMTEVLPAEKSSPK